MSEVKINCALKDHTMLVSCFEERDLCSRVNSSQNSSKELVLIIGSSHVYCQNIPSKLIK